MATSSPLSTPVAWDLVAPGYAADIVPAFTPFAHDALRLARAVAGAHVVDVAAGPGTLTFAAARAGLRVSAIDFAPRMIDELRLRVEAENDVSGIECAVGDGAALPFADGTFDAAFSMFGLMFFPDRAKGFGELFRVLRQGGRAVVSSWVPMDRVPLLAELFGAIRSCLPSLPVGGSQAPLASAGDFRAEMEAAGFTEVDVIETSHAIEAPSLVALWESMRRSNAPVALLECGLGAAEWTALQDSVLAKLHDRFGPGPQRVTMIANLGVGRR
jgi:SAM-dependent methyltransferase